MALGICVGIAAFFYLTRLGVVRSNSGRGVEFDVMIALVLGGFPLAGGSNARFRSAIIGAVIVTILSNGLTLWGLGPELVAGVKGLLFVTVIAVSYDRSAMKEMIIM